MSTTATKQQNREEIEKRIAAANLSERDADIVRTYAKTPKEAEVLISCFEVAASRVKIQTVK